MDERLANWTAVLVNVAYVVAVAAALLMMAPGLRQAARARAAAAADTWRYGRWLERQPRAPQWWPALHRAELPDEGS